MQALDSMQLLQINFWTLAVVILFTCLTHRDQWAARAGFGAVTALLLVNYAAWRIRDTLPDGHSGFATVWAYTFLFFEMLAIGYTLFSIVVMLCRSDHGKEADAGERRLRAQGSNVPAVDIFIATYNEGLEILEKTIIAAQAIDYPNFTIWVLDDTRRDWLRDYCAEVGVQYARRPDNSHAKAGNLNNGLRQSAAGSNAPYILVLDADFAPQQPILMRTLGLFDDPKVGLVQTPQFYYNPDPIQHNLGTSDCWVDEQRVFFDVFQPAKDGWDAAFCVGTSFVVRRDLINEIGGFPTGSVCEDIYTTYRLLQKGYVTRWLNERLSIGLSAEGLTEYINQRGRWCLGTIQVALLKEGPLRGGGYTLNDRLHYIHGLMHWFSKPFILMMLVSPVLYWYFGIAGFYANPVDFLAFGMPALIAFWGYGTWVTDRRTLPIFTEVTQIVASLAVTATIASAMIRPFGRPFKVTAKGLDRTKTMVHWKLFGFFFALTVFSQFGAYIAISTAAAFDGNMLFNLCWTVVALVYNLATLVACVDRPRLHGEERFPFDKASGLRFGGKVLPGRLVDISLSGASLHCAFASSIKPGLCGEMWIDKLGWLEVEVMRNHGEKQLGLRFAELDEPLRRRLIARLFSDATINVVSKADPALAFGTLLRRSLIGEKRTTPRLPAPIKSSSYVPRHRWRPASVRSRKRALPHLSVGRSGLWSLLFMSLLLIGGCSLEPTYEKPDAPIDQQWPANTAGECCAGKQAFDKDWRGFVVDDRLRQLIEMALVNNRSLRQFAASVEEARAGYDSARSGLFPTIGIDTYAGRSKLPPLVRTPNGGDSAGSIANTFQATGGFTSYELDLFGRIRSQRNAAGARFEASEADYQTARLALIGEVASTWLSLKANQHLLDLAQNTYQSQDRYGQLLRKSFNLGSSARIDVHQADAQTNTAAVQVNTYRMQVAQNSNALRVLVGQPVPVNLLPTGALGEQMATLDVPAGLPSSLVERRPDIMSAEAQLRAANADIGAARTAYFPTFSLTSALGSLTGDFSRLLSGPAEFWSVALAGTLPLIDGGARRAQVDASHARFDGQAAAYEATVQNAFREAADALNARQEMLTQVEYQKKLVGDYQEAYRQSRLRFEAGLDSYFSTMDAQRSLFDAQQKWAQLELAREINQVTLYKALGGGWSGALKVADR